MVERGRSKRLLPDCCPQSTARDLGRLPPYPADPVATGRDPRLPSFAFLSRARARSLTTPFVVRFGT